MARLLMIFDADCLKAAAGGLLLMALLSAQAESLPDPTRPPAALDATSPAAGQQAPAGGLQSIIRSNQGKPAAIINGEYVVLGGLVGDARLVAIGEDTVTLRSTTGTETLRLMPGIEKTLADGVPSVLERKGVRRAPTSDTKVTK
jgi:MSHA biogenesis protein MshK